MFLNRLKLVAALALAFAVTCTGAGVLLSRAPAADPPAAGGKAAKEPAPKAAAPANTIQVKNFAVEAVDVAADTLTVADRNQPRWETSVILHTDVPLRLDVSRAEPGKAPLHFDAVQIQKAAVQHWDVVRLVECTRNQPKLQNLPVAKDVPVTLDGRPAKLADLKAGMVVDLNLAAEDGRLVIRSIQARKDGAKK